MPYQVVLSLLLLMGILIGCEQKDRTIDVKTETCEEKRIRNQFIVHWEDSSVSLLKADNPDEFLRQNLKKIKYIEPNYSLTTSFAAPSFRALALNSRQMRDQLGITAAWNQGFRGQGIRVALIDSGVDLKHPELQGRLESGWNFTDGRPEVHDEVGHGTAMAGIITGTGIHSLGLAPQARLLPLDFINETGGNEYDAEQAISYSL